MPSRRESRRHASTVKLSKSGAAPLEPGLRRFRRFCLVGAVLLLAGLFRFYNLDNAPPGLHSDEAADAIDAAEAARTGRFEVFYPGNNGREGLYINTGALLLSGVAAVEPSPLHLEAWMARLASALFGTLTVLGIFFLMRALTDSDFAATAAAFFTAVSLWHLCLSRLGTRAVSSACFLVWALFFLLWGFAKIARSPGWRGWLLLAVAGAVYGAGFHTYTAYRITPVIVLAALIWLARGYRSSGHFRTWIAGAGLFLGMTLLVVSPLAFYFLQHPEKFSSRTAEVSILRSHTLWRDLAGNIGKTILMFNVAGDPNPRHNIAGRPEMFMPVGLLFLGGVALGIWRISRRSQTSWPFVLCFVWAAVGAVPAILSNEGAPHALRSCLMIPPCFMLAALFADQVRLWAAPRLPRYVWPAAVAATVLVIGVEAWISYFVIFAHDPRTVLNFQNQKAVIARRFAAMPDWVPKYFLVVGVQLDERGNPEGYENVALLTGGYTPAERARRNIHFVTTTAEAQRARHTEGAVVWAIRE